MNPKLTIGLTGLTLLAMALAAVPLLTLLGEPRHRPYAWVDDLT